MRGSTVRAQGEGARPRGQAPPQAGSEGRPRDDDAGGDEEDDVVEGEGE
jgi:hypothetical protein